MKRSISRPVSPAKPAAAASEGPNLGSSLRRIRLQRKLSLAEISAVTGISKSTLSRVENGKLSLTYDKLLQLSTGLSVDLAELFAPADGPPIPAPMARRTVTPPGGGRFLTVSLQSYTYLCTELANKKMTPMTGEIHSRSMAETNGLMKHDGEEFTYVLEGQMELHTEFYEPVTVDEGGSVYFDSTMGHAYVSTGKKPLKVLCVCSTPEPALSKALADRLEARARATPPATGRVRGSRR